MKIRHLFIVFLIISNYLFSAEKTSDEVLIGYWKYYDFSALSSNHFDLSLKGKIKEHGDYLVSFILEGGKQKFMVDEVQLIKENRVLSSDKHISNIGLVSAKQNPVYQINIPKVKNIQKLKIRVILRNKNSNHTRGRITIRKK